MTYFLSKFVWIFLRPINASLIGLFIAYVLARAGYKKLQKVLIGLVSVFIFTVCFTSIPDFLLSQMEVQYPRAQIDFSPAGIIVLGGGFDNEIGSIRDSYEITSAGDRMVAGLVLMQKYEGIPLIYSGGSAPIGRTLEPEARSAQKMVEALFGENLPIIYESKARNTWENALLVAELAKKSQTRGKWILITSAFHMPRSIGCFRKAGLDVVAWPTDYRSEYTGGFWLTFKSNKQIVKSQIVIKEIIGLIAYKLLGRIG